MMEYWDHSCSIWLKNNTVHGINKPWIEKTSTEDLKNSEFGLRPLRAVGSLYEPEAVGAIGAYAPEGFQIEKETARSTDSIT